MECDASSDWFEKLNTCLKKLFESSFQVFSKKSNCDFPAYLIFKSSKSLELQDKNTMKTFCTLLPSFLILFFVETKATHYL